MITAVILGVSVGLGLTCVIVGFTRRPEPVLPAGLDAGAAASSDSEKQILQIGAAGQRVAQRIGRDLQSKTLLIEDARMVGRPLDIHAMHKLIGTLIGLFLVTAFAMIANTVMGFNLPVLAIVALGAVGALLGWVLPDSMLRTEADKERVLFQQVTESWLELVAQLVTAGTDTFGALSAAAAYSEQPGFITIREALRVAAVSGEPPWTGLRRLADERRLRFLDPFCAALELAGTTGAGARQAILAQVDAAQSKAMLEADAAAASSGEKMGAPLALIGGGFMVLMGYPPLIGILDTSTLGGL